MSLSSLAVPLLALGVTVDVDVDAGTRRKSGLVVFSATPGGELRVPAGWQVVSASPLFVAPASWAREQAEGVEAWAEDAASAKALAARAARTRKALERWVGPLFDGRLVVVSDREAPDHLGRAWPGVVTASGDDDAVLAHELCHQAFPVRAGEPLWEVEALCQHAAALTLETLDGRAHADALRERTWSKVWDVYVEHGGVAGRADVNAFTSEPAMVAHVYARAPWFYEKARAEAGDDEAWASALKALRTGPREGSVPDFLRGRFPANAAQLTALEREYIANQVGPVEPLPPAPYLVEQPAKRGKCGCDGTGEVPIALALMLAGLRRRGRREA